MQCEYLTCLTLVPALTLLSLPDDLGFLLTLQHSCMYLSKLLDLCSHLWNGHKPPPLQKALVIIKGADVAEVLWAI